MCHANRHGNGKDSYPDKSLFAHTLDIQIDHECAECGEMLTSRRSDRGDIIVFKMMPHRCQIDPMEQEKESL
jgi:hypothetical protein